MDRGEEPFSDSELPPTPDPELQRDADNLLLYPRDEHNNEVYETMMARWLPFDEDKLLEDPMPIETGKSSAPQTSTTETLKLDTVGRPTFTDERWRQVFHRLSLRKLDRKSDLLTDDDMDWLIAEWHVIRRRLMEESCPTPASVGSAGGTLQVNSIFPQL